LNEKWQNDLFRSYLLISIDIDIDI